MFIHEAVRKALEEKRAIKRKLWDVFEDDSTDNATVILPTNSYACCIIKRFFVRSWRKPGELWNPTADDLIADDWEVVDWPSE